MEPRNGWTDEKTRQLISLYEENECLWNPDLPEFWNRHKSQPQKRRVIGDIAARFGVSAEEVQRKLHNLRNQVWQEIKKCQAKKQKSAEEYTSKWKYFTSLQFLMAPLTAKSRQNVLEKQSDSNDSETPVMRPGETKTDDNGKKEGCKPVKRINKPNCDAESEKTAKRPKDEFEHFGEYVTSELKCLKSDYNRRRLKSEIRKVISQIADEDDASYWDQHSPFTSTSSLCTSLIPSVVMTAESVIVSNNQDSTEP